MAEPNDARCGAHYITKLDGKYSERVQIPAKAFLSPALGNTCHTYYFAGLLVPNFPTEQFCKQSPVYGVL